MTTPKIGAPEWAASQAAPYTTVNEGLRYAEQGARFYIVKDKDLGTPPGSPADGDAYIVPSGATGAWSGWAGRIAFRLSTSWVSITPEDGVFAWAQDEGVLYYYDTGVSPDAWTLFSLSGAGYLLAANNLSDVANAATAGANIRPVESLVMACSDETTALTSGTAKLTLRAPYAFTVTGVRASLTTAQTSGSTFTVDINESGTSIISTKLTIDNTEKTSTTAATPAVISDSSIADDAEITVDIDTIGDGTAKGLKVVLIGHRT